MSNNKSMQILRGTNASIANSADTLLPGQLLYNYDKNYITVGGKDGTTPLNSAPIVARELVGYLDDTGEKIGEDTIVAYHAGLENGAFEVVLRNSDGSYPHVLRAGNGYFSGGQCVSVDSSGIKIGALVTITDNGVALGKEVVSTGSNSIAIGSSVETTGLNSIAIRPSTAYSEKIAAKGEGAIAVGAGAVASSSEAIAIGSGTLWGEDFAVATAHGAVQIGIGTNSTANTLQFRSRTIVDADGKINADTATKARSVTPDDWSSTRFNGSTAAFISDPTAADDGGYEIWLYLQLDSDYYTVTLGTLYLELSTLISTYYSPLFCIPHNESGGTVYLYYYLRFYFGKRSWIVALDGPATARYIPDDIELRYRKITAV